jgi:hypothetical protein
MEDKELVGVGAYAPIKPPFEHWIRLVQRQGLERWYAVEVEECLGPKPSAQPPGAGYFDVEVGEVGGRLDGEIAIHGGNRASQRSNIGTDPRREGGDMQQKFANAQTMR